MYFDKGGSIASSPRCYQSGGSVKEMMQQVYQLTQVVESGSGQQQQQAMQALGQFIVEAMNGNQQYAQIIQTIFEGAKKGDKTYTQMAQVIQPIMQQMQQRMEFGGSLEYIKRLREGGRA